MKNSLFHILFFSLISVVSTAQNSRQFYTVVQNTNELAWESKMSLPLNKDISEASIMLPGRVYEQVNQENIKPESGFGKHLVMGALIGASIGIISSQLINKNSKRPDSELMPMLCGIGAGVGIIGGILFYVP